MVGRRCIQAALRPVDRQPRQILFEDPRMRAPIAGLMAKEETQTGQSISTPKGLTIHGRTSFPCPMSIPASRLKEMLKSAEKMPRVKCVAKAMVAFESVRARMMVINAPGKTYQTRAGGNLKSICLHML